jgi:hypothetical protein
MYASRCRALAWVLLLVAATSWSHAAATLNLQAREAPAEATPRLSKQLPPAPSISNDELEPVDPATLALLADIADRYRARALGFECRETRRRVRYNEDGEATRERLKRFSLLLAEEGDPASLVELRYKPGRTRASARKEGDLDVPAAYEWLLLFSRRQQPFFTYSDLGTGDEGGRPTREIAFRGALGFEDGDDVREWEGAVLLDALTHATLEVRADPVNQPERIEALYRRWKRSLKVKVGIFTSPDPLAPPGTMPEFAGTQIRAAPRAKGRRFAGEYRRYHEGLTLPTRGRYETVEVVGLEDVRAVAAEIRTYDNYRFFRTAASEEEAALD